VKIALGAGAVAIIAVIAASSVVVFMRNSDKATLSDAGYARLFEQAVVNKTTIAVLDRWPKPPYQTFGDNFHNQYYEWLDARPKALYTLCFKGGLLEIKSSD
jgi:hypothetical protein